MHENEKVSEKNWLHTASATAKRFSSTIKYTASSPAVYLATLQIEKSKSAAISITRYSLSISLSANAAGTAVDSDTTRSVSKWTNRGTP